MSRSGLRERFTYANVVATLALVLALTGATALAASKLGKNSVKSKQLAPGAVHTSDIANDAVTGDKVKESTLGVVPSATHASSADTAGSAANATNAAHAAVADSLGNSSISPANVVHTQNASGSFNSILELDVNGYGRFWLFCRQNSLGNNEDDELTFNEQDAVQNAIGTGLLAASEFPGAVNEVSTINGPTVEPNASREYGTDGRRFYVHYVVTAIGTGKSIEITGGGFDDNSTPGCVGQLHASISG